jgi:hypothetical protein
MGMTTEVTSTEEQNAVHEAIPYGSFDPSHPIFQLSITRAIWVWWENAGQPDTCDVRRAWPGSSTLRSAMEDT